MSTSMGGGRGFGATGKPTKIGNTGYQSITTQKFTPEQMQLFQSMFGNVGPDSYLGKLAAGDEATFNQIEAPALKQFAGFQGNLASRFSGQGGVGARNSSGFQNANTSAAQNFAEQLQSQRTGLQMNATQQLHQMSQDLLNQRPYEQYVYEQEQKQPAWKKLVGGALPIAGAAAGGFFGGWPGAKIGGSIGSAAAQGFFS